MTTEGSPTPAARAFLLSSDALAIIVAIIALGAAIIGTLLMQVQSLSQQTAADLHEISDSDRQADTRAINACVDAAEQMVVTTSLYRCPPIS